MRIHPVEFEVFKNVFLSIAEELGVALCRSSFSPNIKERLDYSCAVYDAKGGTIAQGDHMPVHLGAMPLSVRAAMDALPMTPGDIVALNDPFQGGTHLPDITLVSPVFLGRDARPSFFVANRAHHSDVGGMSPGSMPVAREIFQEGLIIPPVYLARRGKMARDVMSMILANVRTPGEREGDLAAQIAANRVAEARLRDVVASYGRARVTAYGSALQDYTERVVRAAISEIPPGEYSFEDALDDDGFSGRPVKIAVKIRVEGGRAVIDFTGTAPQVEGSVNANYAITLSACLYAFRCLVRDNVLYNSGVGRPLRVIAPAGSVVNAQKPAAVAGGNVETSQRYHRRGARRAGQGFAGPLACRQPGHDEQRHPRRHGPAHGHALRLLRNHRRRDGRAARPGGPERRPHPHEQHAQHAGRSDGALPPPAHPPLPVAHGQHRTRRVSRRTRHHPRI